MPGIAYATAVFAGAAQAATLTSFLTLSDPAAGVGVGPYAKIEISQGANANTVNVVETMLSPFYLVNTGGPHNALTWNIAGTETITILGAPAGYSLQNGPTNSPFGSFEWGLDCASCTKGAPGAFAGPLTFSINSSAALDPTKFTVNSGGYLFSSDVGNSTGSTGNVASVVTGVPEPETYAMLLAGLGLMGVVVGRRKQRPA